MVRIGTVIAFVFDFIQKQNSFQIFQFSLQILQLPLELSGMRFFTLDYDLLQSMAASITTYMVIFIGFLPAKSIFPDYSTMNQLFK